MTTNKTPSDTTASASVAGVEGAELPPQEVSLHMTAEEFQALPEWPSKPAEMPMQRYALDKTARSMFGATKGVWVKFSDAQARIDSLTADLTEARAGRDHADRKWEDLSETTLELRSDLAEAQAERDAAHAAANHWSDEEAKARAEIAALQAAHREASPLTELLDQMHHFANCDMKLWDESLRTDADFKSWVQSRARHLLEKHGIGSTSSTGGDHGE